MIDRKCFAELDQSYDRNGFDCGENDLNIFLKTQALRHMKAGISKTFVLPVTEDKRHNKTIPICAFYTIAVSSMKRTVLPIHLSKNLPHYPVPVFVLAQMGGDSKFHRQGFGKATLVTALRKFYDVNCEMPAYAVVVDSLNPKAKAFYTNYGFKYLCANQGKDRLFLSMNSIVKMFNGQ